MTLSEIEVEKGLEIGGEGEEEGERRGGGNEGDTSQPKKSYAK